MEQVALYVKDYNQDADKAILLVHGWPLSQKMFEYQLPYLLEEGYRVVTFDIRGFGESDSAIEGYNYEQMAADIETVVHDHELLNFDLLGFSMGGALAAKYAANYSGVRKLILLDAAAPSYCVTENNPHGQTVESTNDLITLGYNDRPALNKYFGSIFFEQEHTPEFVNWVQRMSDSASPLGEMLSLVALRDEDIYNDLAKIKVPTAIIHGLQDKICKYGMAEIMHEQIQNSTLYPIDNAGHGAFYDQRDKVNAAIIEFLNG